MRFYLDMDSVMEWVAGSGPARKLRLHEFRQIVHAPKQKPARGLSIDDAFPAPGNGSRVPPGVGMPSPATGYQSPTSSDFEGYYSSPATQGTSTPSVPTVWTSRLSSSSDTSSSSPLYIVCKGADARAQVSRFPANGAHNGFRHPLYRESRQEERKEFTDIRQLRSQSNRPTSSPAPANANNALSVRNVSRTGSAKSMSSVRSNASTDTIQHILETDSSDMIGFGRWRHHKDVSLQWLENKIREEFTGPGANCLFGTKTFATTDHPLVAEYIARKRALDAEREVAAGFPTTSANNSSSSLLEPTKRTESSVSIGKDGCIVQTGFLTRSESVGSTLSDTSTSSSDGSALEMPQKKEPVPKILARSVNPDVELSASVSADPVTPKEAEKLKQAASQFSQAAVSTSYLATCLAQEQLESVVEEEEEAEQELQLSDHVHFATHLERRCIIVKPEDAENAIESDDEDCEILPLRPKTPSMICSRPMKGILKRPSDGSGIATPEVSTPELCPPSVSSKPLCIALRPCNSIDIGYNIVSDSSNATGMGKKRKSVEFAPRPRVYNVPAMQRRQTQRPRQRSFARRSTAIKAS